MASTGCSSGPGQPEHDQERGEVAEHQVLGHVDPDQLVVERRQRRDQGDQDQQHRRGEAELAPRRHRPAAARERAGAERVERRHDRDGDQLKRLERALQVGDRELHAVRLEPLDPLEEAVQHQGRGEHHESASG